MSLEKLKEPFAPDDIEWRIQQSGDKNGKPWGKVLAYVTNRAIMERLDSVVGPENWKNEFGSAPNGGVICILYVRVDGEWIGKMDGADNTDIEAVKGGLSNAMKRAAVHWGIGRYLYNLESGWANFCDNGKYSAKINNTFHKWNPPTLPDWALPSGTTRQPVQEPERSVHADPTDAETKVQSDPPTESQMQQNYINYLKVLKGLGSVKAVNSLKNDNWGQIVSDLGGEGSPHLTDFLSDMADHVADITQKVAA